MTGLYLGQAVGGFGATIAAAFSWHQTFFCFGIVGVAYAALLSILLEDRRGNAGSVESTEADEANAKEKVAGEPVWKSFVLIFSNISFWTILFFFATSSLPGWSTKNWLPTLFAESLGIPMSQAGPLSTITIAVSSFFGVLIGGSLSDRWVKRNLRGRIYTSAIGLALMIPALVFIGLGSGLFSAIGAGVCFGVGYGMFDTNNMPILCQFVSSRHRATAYGIMNMTGVFFGALITQVLGRWADQGNLGVGFALMAAALGIALMLQLTVLRPTTDNMD